MKGYRTNGSNPGLRRGVVAVGGSSMKGYRTNGSNLEERCYSALAERPQ